MTGAATFAPGDPATWIARGRKPEHAAALAKAWRDFPDLPAHCPLEDPTARMLITRSCLAEFASGSTADGLAAQVQLVRAVGAHVFAGAGTALREAGEFEFRGTAVYFKIDAYDLALEYGSEDPADASVTTRVLTMMLAQDL